MRCVLAFLLALLISAAAEAQSRSVYSPPDPFLLTEFVSGTTVVPGNADTTGMTPVATINTAETNIVIILAGDSLGANTSGVLNIPTNTARINNVNIYDGAAYAITGNMLGCSNSTIGPGNLGAYIADDLMNAHGTYRVWMVTIAIGGTKAADWATGNLADRAGAAMRRLASRGITPATTNTYFLFIPIIGTNDTATSSASFQASFATMMSNITAAGFSGRTFLPLATQASGVTNATIRAAQAAVVNNTTIFQGGDFDTVTGGTKRNADGTHFIASGATDAAALLWTAIHATGAPY